MSHTFSQAWLSESAKQLVSWTKIKRNMRRVSPNSPFTPKTAGEWLTQQIVHKKAECHAAKRRIEARGNENGYLLDRVLKGKQIGDHPSLVLAKETIWVPIDRYQPGWLLARWPTHDELRFNGDDANRSRCLRFPPLPRYPGDPTTNWELRKELPQRAFDRVVRQTEAYYQENIQCSTEEMVELIGHSLLAELDV